MPLKKKEVLEEEPQEKVNEGGERLNEQEIKSIAVAVKALIDQSNEKKKVSDQLGGVTKEVGELKGELGKVKQGMYCSPDGKYCFYTPEALNDFMIKQAEEMKEVKGVLTTVVERVNNMKPPKGELPEGVVVLEPMSEKKRKTMTDEQNRIRDGQVAANDKALNQTSNDRFRQMDETDRDRIVAKPDMRQRFLKTLSPTEIKEAMVIGCKGDECKVIRGELENDEGYRIYKKDANGNFQPIDEEKKKPLIF